MTPLSRFYALASILAIDALHFVASRPMNNEGSQHVNYYYYGDMHQSGALRPRSPSPVATRRMYDHQQTPTGFQGGQIYGVPPVQSSEYFPDLPTHAYSRSDSFGMPYLQDQINPYAFVGDQYGTYQDMVDIPHASSSGRLDSTFGRMNIQDRQQHGAEDAVYHPVDTHGRRTIQQFPPRNAIDQTATDFMQKQVQRDAFEVENGPLRGNVNSRKRHPVVEGCSWKLYNKDVKAHLVEMLHLYTGYLKEPISRKCRSYFTESMKEKLLYGTAADVIKVAADLDLQESRQDWMANMSMDDSIKVVQRMANAAGKDPEHVRNYFLRKALPVDIAEQILADETQDLQVCRSLAKEIGLDRQSVWTSYKGRETILSPTIRNWPWMKRINIPQMRQAVKILEDYTGYEKEQLLDLLQHSEEGLGQQILKAKGAQLRLIIHNLMAAPVISELSEV
ncbi:hypothetical protein CBS101457_000140 [Exobasidium rhododendri]|nr:hypothetical protein CBS101457_000140 [Exobasidium rhododendri]